MKTTTGTLLDVRHDSINQGFSKPLFIVLVIISIGLANSLRALAGTATLTVGSTPEQTFKAFGFSITMDRNPWVKGKVNDGNRETFDQEAFNQLNARFVRWWIGIGSSNSLAEFNDGYVKPGVTAEARSHGVQQFLFAPSGSFPPETADGETLSNVNLYAKILADDIKQIKDKFGVNLEVTGIINEPGAARREKVIPQELRAPVVKAVRSELDRHGLKNVQLIAPETASCDNDAVQWAKAIDADRAAAAMLNGFATHSYNMAATPEVAAYVRKNGWDYWQTECGADGDGNTASARFLNDLNNRVTHWTFFIGPHSGPSSMALLAPDRKSFAYYYLRLLSDKFIAGTVMRHVKSDIDGGEMVYTYGQKPYLNAAAGVRPDGKWVIGVVNDSSGPSRPQSRYYPAEDFDVTINVSELAGKGKITFGVCRTCHSDTQLKCEETAIMENGVVKIHLRPKELATLVAQTAVAK